MSFLPILLHRLINIRFRTGLLFLTALFLCLCYLLMAVGIHHKTVQNAEKQPQPANSGKDTMRELKADYINSGGGDRLSLQNKPDNFVDVPKQRAGPLALSHAVFSKNMAMLRDPTHYLKQSLQDKTLMKKMRDMEDHRQDLYLKLLRKRGQLVTSVDGSQTIISYPSMPLQVPNTLKYRRIEDWTKTEKMWKNV